VRTRSARWVFPFLVLFLTCSLPSAALAFPIADPTQLSPGFTLIDFESASDFTNPYTVGEVTFTSITGSLVLFNISDWPANGTEVESTTLFPGAEPDSAISISFATPVAEFLLGWGDPNFEGNVLRAFDIHGNLLEEAKVALGPIGGLHAAWIGFKRPIADIASILVQPDQSRPSGDDYVIDNIHYNTHADSAPPSSKLSVDFGSDDTAGPVQIGYVEWAGRYVGNPGLNYNETRSFRADFGVGGVVNVTVNSDGLFFRDYSPIVGGPFQAQSALISDNILRNQPGSIFLTFNSLTDGVYSMMSYHHDTVYGSTFVPFNIILTDGLVTKQTLFSGLDTTGGTEPSSITKADYNFTVVGGSAVTIEFAGQAQPAQHMSINGFQLERIGPANASPVCKGAQAFPSVLWAVNGQFVPIAIMGVTDPDGDSVTLTVTGLTQDEPVKGAGAGNTSPDAFIEAGAASVRAERSGTGNGRVYQIFFRAEDGKGGSCTNTVKVSVPHSLQKGLVAVDDGQLYDSTAP